MKKFILLTVTLLAFNNAFSQTLEGKITYRAEIVDSHLDFLTHAPNPILDRQDKRGEDALPIDFHLFFAGNESLYKVGDTKLPPNFWNNETNIVGKKHHTYYTNMATKEKFFEYEHLPGLLVNMDDIDWKLTKETKKIGKYTCFKATATIAAEQTFGGGYISPIRAWYTPDIPVPFGIQGFVGLPGLMMELIVDTEQAEIQFMVTKIELDQKEGFIVERLKGTRQMSEQEYVEHIKKLNARRRKEH